MSGTPITVLLVEDDPDQAELIQRALKRQPIPVEISHVLKGPDCLHSLAQKKYSALLLDYSLPGMNGLEVLRKLRLQGSRVPVIMVTGQGDERIAVEAMQEGASDYLIKTAGYLTTLPTMLSKVLKQHELAMENLRLLEETRQRAQEQEVLNAIATAVSQSLAMTDLLRIALEKVLEVTGRERGYIYLRDHETGKGRIVIQREVSEQALRRLLTRPGRIDEVFTTGVPSVVNDAMNDPLLEESSREGIQALVLIPMSAKGKVVGVLNVSTRQPLPFRSQEINLLQAIGNVIGVALENARLYEETELRRREAEELARIARTLTESLDMGAVSQRIVESVRRFFGVESSAVCRLQPDQSLLALAVDGAVSPIFQAGTVLPPGTGVVGLAAMKGEAVFCADIVNDPEVVLTELHQRFAVLGNRTALAVPLRSKGQIIGALSISDQLGRLFTEAEVLLLQRFADQAALALENARLFEETERRRHEAEELARAARSLTESLDVHDVSERIVDGVQRLFGVESAVVVRLQADRSLVALASAGRIREVYQAGLVLPPGSGIVGRAAATGKAVISTDIMNDPEVVLTEAHHKIAPSGSRSVLAVPLRSKGETIGALGIADQVGRLFTEAEVSLLQAFADQAALALENARLYDAGRHREQIARSLYEIGKAISSTLDPTTLLARIGEKAIEVIGASKCAVFEMNETDQRLYVRATKGVGPNHQFVPIKLGQGASGVAAAERRPVFSPDILTDPLPGVDEIVEEVGVPFLEISKSGGFRAILAAPLISRGAVIGAICIYWDEVHAYQEEEAEILSSFADQAAIALQNARLFQESKQAYDELKQTQNQMIHVEKLRALGEMAGGVAHDFNNLLAAILGRAQYALLCMGELSEHDIRRCLTVIEQAALDGAETVRRLLDFTRGKARQQELTSVNVNELLSYIVEASRPRWKDEAEAKGITIQVDCLPGDVAPIAGNPVELREVLLNFVFNAIEAMPQGGVLSLRSFMEGDKVCVRLEDTGHGMPEEVRRRIFDPFFTTKGPQRSGLGLSVSYGIIRRHEGEIEVESREGKGTSFTIRLPVRAAPPPPIRVSEAITTASYRLLVVDDETPVREMLEEILRAAGHHVVTAEGGFQALDLLREQTFDFVCTDLGMPGMNGWELVQRVKAEWPAVRIALITGWGVQIEPEEVIANGVDVLISKPFEVKEILRALAAAGQTSATTR